MNKQIAAVLLLMFAVFINATCADYTENVQFGVLKPGDPLTAAAHPPGRILPEYDAIIISGGMTWADSGPGSWTASVSDTFAGKHHGYFTGKYVIEGTGGGGSIALKDWDMNTDGVLYKIKIFRGSTDVTDQVVDVCVGEKVTLTAKHFPESATLSNKQWNPAGSPVKGYITTRPLGQIVPMEAGDLQEVNLSTYWPQSGSNKVVFDGSLDGNSVSASTTIKVHLPTVNFTSVIPFGVNIWNPDGLRFGLHSASVGAGQAGIQFAISQPNSDPVCNGSPYYVNFVRSSNTMQKYFPRRPLDPFECVETTASGLDSPEGSDWYYSSSTTTNDSPNTPLNDSLTLVSDSREFSMYIFWKHSSADSIFVPVRRSDWFYSGQVSAITPGNLNIVGTPTFGTQSPGVIANSLIEWNKSVPQDNIVTTSNCE